MIGAGLVTSGREKNVSRETRPYKTNQRTGVAQLKWWNRFYHRIGRTSVRPYSFGASILIH
ncbi:hypothetical protein MC7420_5876 [Coleofasciculus chthonoplastes PCC 7420]|uniref:Uncharacterized protein n=1 Tax=Coleofasciculus chthonoplastes PCC 7420 TaxID=118168 RepID=B4VVU8_9CYAN|nr:hypothetical protein MC7420_5876 [Coleofasciculus chthonoplastes PCC 7420]